MPKTDLNILLNTKYEGRGLTDLKKELKDNQKAMEDLTTAGKRNSAEFRTLQTQNKELGNVIRGLTREYKGLEAQQKLSRAQLLEMGENISSIFRGSLALISTVKNVTTELFSLAQSGAELSVLRENFQGTAEDLELLRKASTGNLNDKELLTYANSMKLLGHSTEASIKLLDIAERKGDAVGIGFDTANSALQKFILTGAGKGLVDLGINVADVEEQTDRLTNTTKEQRDELSDLEQQQLRTNVVLDLFGGSMEDIIAKEPDIADTLEGLITKGENLTTAFGEGLSKGIAETTKKLEDMGAEAGVTESTMEKFGNFIGDIFVRTMNLIGQEITQIEKEIKTIGEVSDQVAKDFKEDTENLKSHWTFLSEFIALNPIHAVIRMIIGEELEIPKIKASTDDLNTAVDRMFAINEQASKIWGLQVPGEIIEEEKKPPKPKKTGGKGKPKEAKEITNELIDLQKELDKLNEKVSITTEPRVLEGLQKDIDDTILQMRFLRGEFDSIIESSTDIKLPDKKISLFSPEELEAGRALLDNIDLLEVERTEPISDDSEERAKTIEDSFLGSMTLAQQITDILGLGADHFINVMLNGLSSAVDIANSIFSLLASIAGGGAGGVFGFLTSFLGLQSGGTAHRGRGYIVGEDGAELFMPNVTGTVVPHDVLTSLLNSIDTSGGRLADGIDFRQSSPVANVTNINKVFIGTETDHARFFEISESEYQKYIQSKII